MTKSPTVPPRRNPVVTVIDIVVGVAIALIGIVFGLVILSTAGQYISINEGGCTADSYAGLECNAGALSLAVSALTAVTIFAWAITSGLFIVRLLKRRIGFYWPIIGIVLMVAGFWIATYFVGQIAEQAS